MKLLFAIAGILLIIIIGIIGVRMNNGKSFFSLNKPVSGSHVNIHGKTYKLLIAKTEKEKEIGLSSRISLPSDQGMIFPYDKADYYRFWMKDMKFPIDIIFLNNKKVVTIFSNIPPPALPTDNLPIYEPDAPSSMILELNANEANKQHLKKGDTIEIVL